MCTHVWQKATTRSAERRPMSGLGTGNGRGKQKQKKKKNQRSSLRTPDHMSRVLRAAGRAAGAGHVRSTTTVPPARATLARRRGAPARPPSRASSYHRARAMAPCVVVGALPPPADSSQLECTRRRRTTCRRRDHARMHACTPVRAFFDRAPSHIHLPRRPVAARTHTYGTRLHVRTVRAVRTRTDARPASCCCVPQAGAHAWYYCTVLLAAQCRACVYNCPVCCRARRRRPDPPRPSPRAIQQLAS